MSCVAIFYFSIVVLAGDISPMDILTHLPVLAEDASCPYIFVSSKELLGQASSTKRPTSCVMMCPADLKSNPKMSKKAKEVIEKAAADQEKGAELKEYSAGGSSSRVRAPPVKLTLFGHRFFSTCRRELRRTTQRDPHAGAFPPHS